MFTAGSIMSFARNTLLTLCTLACCAGALAGQAPLGSVDGHVVNGVTQHPIGQALVLLNEAGRQVTTDLSGRFHLEDVPPGVYA